MDVTSVALAVDSTQVNSASAALDKMAASGTKAGTSAALLTKATTLQGKALSAGLTPAADKAAASIADIADAGKKVGAGGFAAASAALAAEAAQAAKAQVAIAAVEVAQGKLARATQLAADAQAKLNALQLAPKSIAPQALAAAQVRVTETQAAVGSATARLAAAEAARAALSVAKGNGEIGKSAKFAAFQQQQLGFQLHDFAVQVASGQSPLTAFIQQGSQLSGTFGGAGNAFRAVTGLLTPLRVAIGGVAAGVGALAFSFLEGSKQSKEFADAIVLTGNFAGQTEGKFNSMARSLASSGQIGVAATREFGQALISTGQVGPEVFQRATEAATRFGDATGQTAAEVAKDFASMAQGAAKWATEHNRSLNFLTAAQLKQIQTFEESGRAADAQGVIYDALNERLRKLEPNLGLIDRALRATKSGWQNFWDAAFDIGRADTIEGKLARVDAAIAERQARGPLNQLTAGAFEKGNAQLQTTRNGLLLDQQKETERAFLQSQSAITQREGDAANTFVAGYLKRTKSVEQLNKTLDEAKKKFDDAARAGTPVAAKDQAAVLGQIKKDFAPAKVAKDNEPDQIRRANLDADLKRFQDQLQQERDAISFHNRFLQGEYQAGNISLKAYYDDKRATTAAGVAAELAELDKEKARIAQDRDATKDPSEKRQLQTKIDDTDRLQAKIRRDAANDVSLANQQEREAFKQLDEQIIAYRANLLQLSGDEAGAAAIRAKLAATQLSDFAAKSQGRPGAITEADQAASAKSLADLNTVNESKRQTSFINERLVIEEERIALAQRTGALSENAALQAQGEARAKLLPLLQAQADELQRIADANPLNLELRLDASRARLEIEKLSAELDPLKEKFDNLFKDAGSNALGDLLSGKFAKVDESKLNQKLAEIDRKFNAKSDRIKNDSSLTAIQRGDAQILNERDRRKAEKRATKDAQPTIAGQAKSTLTAFGSQVGSSLTNDIAKQASASIFGKGGVLGDAGGVFAGIFGGKKGNPLGESGGVPDSGLKDLFKEPAGNTASVAASFASLQTTGIDPATAALERLAQAFDSAAGSFGRAPGVEGAATPVGEGFGPAGGFDFGGGSGATTGEKSISDLFKDVDEASQTSAKSTAALGRTADATGNGLLRLAASAAQGNSALSLLPQIISLISAAASTSAVGGGSSGGGLLGAVAGLFTGGGTGAVTGAFSQTAIGGSGFGSGLAYGNEDLGAFFDSGGYTGNKGSKEPAGVVHGKEFVFSAPAVQRIGVANLDRMHKAAKHGEPALAGYESGGYVGNASLMPTSGRQYLKSADGGSTSKPQKTGGDTYNVDLSGLKVDSHGYMDAMAEDRAARNLARKAQMYLGRRGS